jgi:pyridoxine 5-phosphate synthase
MTKLSVNLNKIALLRNSRGRDFPNVVEFAKKFIELGVEGITIHPRQDERHITRQDARDLAEFLKAYPGVELNIEGFPLQNFMKLLQETKPDQCTLVPDAADQLTSDHGWDLKRDRVFLREILARIKQIRKLSADTWIFATANQAHLSRSADRAG